jgi:hypothetical protein
MSRIDALDELRNEVLATIEGRTDYLDALTVAQPVGVGKEVWQRQVEAMLFDMHLDGIDVHVDGPADNGPWIKQTHLAPSWS